MKQCKGSRQEVEKDEKLDEEGDNTLFLKNRKREQSKNFKLKITIKEKKNGWKRKMRASKRKKKRKTKRLYFFGGFKIHRAWIGSQNHNVNLKRQLEQYTIVLKQNLYVNR